jgi:pilus assembly protein Flp/PilA
MERITLWTSALLGRFERLRTREDGQALIEYALILTLIAVVVVGALQAIGTSVSTQINAVATVLAGA